MDQVVFPRLSASSDPTLAALMGTRRCSPQEVDQQLPQQIKHVQMGGDGAKIELTFCSQAREA